jgi:hypothetical protein
MMRLRSGFHHVEGHGLFVAYGVEHRAYQSAAGHGQGFAGGFRCGFRGGQAAGRAPHEKAGTRAGFDDAARFKPYIRLVHGADAHAKVAAQNAQGRQFAAHAQHAGVDHFQHATLDHLVAVVVILVHGGICYGYIFCNLYLYR